MSAWAISGLGWAYAAIVWGLWGAQREARLPWYRRAAVAVLWPPLIVWWLMRDWVRI